MRKIHFLFAAIAAAIIVTGIVLAVRSRPAASASSSDAHDHGEDGHGSDHADEHDHDHDDHGSSSEVLRLSPQARLNLGLVSKPLVPSSYAKRIELPGVVTEFPGVSDHSVVAPVAGIVTRIWSHAGETLAHDAPLISLRLVSESLHASQRELFKAAQELEIHQQHRKRLADLTESGALAQSRLIEIDNQISRTNATIQAYRQELASRGLSPKDIDQAATGQFITETIVRAPTMPRPEHTHATTESARTAPPEDFSFEMKEIRVELGQQVEAGQLLCNISDHRTLLIEGHGFKDDVSLIQQAAKNQLPIEVQFERKDAINWPPSPPTLTIHHVGNTIDPDTRTFHFDLVLSNDWQLYKNRGEERILWRHRPGDRARLFVTVERIDDVFVLPNAALVREGAEAYIFQQNGDEFMRRPVHVLHEDQDRVAIARDAVVAPGIYIAQNSAASLNRMLNAQAARGQPAGVHVHADGSVHGAH